MARLPFKSSPLLAFSSVKTTSSEWPHRLGHPTIPILKHSVSSYNSDFSSFMLSSPLCHACNCNKSYKLAFNTSSLVSFQPLEFLFFDMWTSPVIVYNDYKYYVIFVDHFRKYFWFYPLKQKS